MEHMQKKKNEKSIKILHTNSNEEIAKEKKNKFRYIFLFFCSVLLKRCVCDCVSVFICQMKSKINNKI